MWSDVFELRLGAWIRGEPWALQPVDNTSKVIMVRL